MKLRTNHTSSSLSLLVESSSSKYAIHSSFWDASASHKALPRLFVLLHQSSTVLLSVGTITTRVWLWASRRRKQHSVVNTSLFSICSLEPLTAIMRLLDLSCFRVAFGRASDIAAFTGTSSDSSSAFSSFSILDSCDDLLERSRQNRTALPAPRPIDPICPAMLGRSPVTDSHHSGYPRRVTEAIRKMLILSGSLWFRVS